MNFTQVRACTSVTVLSTRWHRGSLHSFLTGAQLLKTCVSQNWSRNQLHLLTCWTLVKPPHCSACIFLLQLWVQSVEEQIQETEPKPAFAIASKASAVHLFWLQKVSESVLFSELHLGNPSWQLSLPILSSLASRRGLGC